MKIVKVLMLFLILAAASAVLAKDQTMLLWGSQRAQWITAIWQTGGNEVVLAKKARIAAVTSDAPSYCIWTQGKAVLCGAPDFPLEGKTLDPGRYSVFPKLRKQQTKARVEITLEYIE